MVDKRTAIFARFPIKLILVDPDPHQKYLLDPDPHPFYGSTGFTERLMIVWDSIDNMF